MIIFRIIIFLSGFCVGLVLADDHPPPVTQVLGMTDIDTSYAFDMADFYGIAGNSIRYYISPRSENANVVLDCPTYPGERFTISLADLLERAAALWSPAINLIRVTSLDASQINVYVRLSGGLDTDSFAITEFARARAGTGSRASITVYSQAFNCEDVSNDYFGFGENGVISQGMDFREYAELQLLEVMVHELGHAFGLLHEDAVGSAGPIQRTWGGVLVPQTSWQRPSIMLSGGSSPLEGYLSQLQRYYGRTVTRNDIRPSSNDIQAVRIMMSGGPLAAISNLLGAVISETVFSGGVMMPHTEL